MQDADQIVADCADLLASHALDAAKAREVVLKGMLADQPLALRAADRRTLRDSNLDSAQAIASPQAALMAVTSACDNALVRG